MNKYNRSLLILLWLALLICIGYVSIVEPIRLTFIGLGLSFAIVTYRLQNKGW
jgi:hypothetical protein